MTKIKLESLNKEIEIKKSPLKTYIEVLKSLEQLPEQFKKFDKMNQDTLIAELPKMIVAAYPDFQKVAKVVCGLSDTEVDLLNLDEMIDIVFAIVEENEFFQMADKVKKNIARIKGKKQEKQ